MYVMLEGFNVSEVTVWQFIVLNSFFDNLERNFLGQNFMQCTFKDEQRST